MELNKKDIISMFSLNKNNLDRILKLDKNESVVIDVKGNNVKIVKESKNYRIEEVKQVAIIDGVKKLDLNAPQIKSLLEMVKRNDTSGKIYEGIKSGKTDYTINVNGIKSITIYEGNNKTPCFNFNDSEKIKTLFDEALLKEPKKFVDGEKYKLKENVICLDKTLLDYFSRGDNSYFGEETIKHLVNASLIKDNKVDKDSIVTYNENEKAFVDDATDRRIFVSEDFITFNIEPAEGGEGVDLDLGEKETPNTQEPNEEGEIEAEPRETETKPKDEKTKEQPEEETIDNELEDELNS